MQHKIEEKLRRETKPKYKNLDKKTTTKERNTNNDTTRAPHTFYPTVINNTDIPFTNSETALFQKGLKYNIHSKKKNWTKKSGLEAETVIWLCSTVCVINNNSILLVLFIVLSS